MTTSHGEEQGRGMHVAKHETPAYDPASLRLGVERLRDELRNEGIGLDADPTRDIVGHGARAYLAAADKLDSLLAEPVTEEPKEAALTRGDQEPPAASTVRGGDGSKP